MRRMLAVSLAANFTLAPMPAAAQYAPPVLIGQWGQPGNGMGQFAGRLGIAVDATGTVYVAVSGNNVIEVFTRDGVFLRQWGGTGTGDGKFRGPSDVAVGPDGSIYVCDMTNQRIQVFSPDGIFLRKWGSFGTGDGQFSSPYSIDIAADGSVFVLDAQDLNHRVQVFAPGGTFLRRWTVSSYPGCVALDGFGGVWVPDYVSGIVRKYSLTGTPLMYIGNTSPLSYPSAVDVDQDGRIYISTDDPGILVFAATGDLLGAFPPGVVADDLRFDADDNLLVTSGWRVLVYNTQVPTTARSSTWGRLKALYR